jgi:hypothetical protein
MEYWNGNGDIGTLGFGFSKKIVWGTFAVLFH